MRKTFVSAFKTCTCCTDFKNINEQSTAVNASSKELHANQNMLDLFKSILENNYYEFNSKYGSVQCPEKCDIIRDEITNKVMSQFKKPSEKSKVVFHGRYRDDEFIIYNGSSQEARHFYNIGKKAIYRNLPLKYQSLK